MDVTLNQLDINQCEDENSKIADSKSFDSQKEKIKEIKDDSSKSSTSDVNQLKTFRNTHKCHSKTSQVSFLSASFLKCCCCCEKRFENLSICKPLTENTTFIFYASSYWSMSHKEFGYFSAMKYYGSIPVSFTEPLKLSESMQNLSKYWHFNTAKPPTSKCTFAKKRIRKTVSTLRVLLTSKLLVMKFLTDKLQHLPFNKLFKLK